MLLAFIAWGCGDHASTEAKAFLDRVERIDISAPPADRRPYVDALEGLHLDTAEIVTARDACVRGHRALLDAEEAQLEAARALGALTDGNADARISPEEASRIEATIQRSSASVEEARGLLERCQNGTDDVRTHYRSRG